MFYHEIHLILFLKFLLKVFIIYRGYKLRLDWILEAYQRELEILVYQAPLCFITAVDWHSDTVYVFSLKTIKDGKDLVSITCWGLVKGCVCMCVCVWEAGLRFRPGEGKVEAYLPCPRLYILFVCCCVMLWGGWVRAESQSSLELNQSNCQESMDRINDDGEKDPRL